jgi:amino acid transporter
MTSDEPQRAPVEAPAPLAGPSPQPLQSGLDVPGDSIAYRVKRRLLGNPLHTEQLEHERLGKPTALAVFASDNLSSSAYATEEILAHLIPYVGLAAFALVVPITLAMLVVLFFLILSYRETIKAYPSAGGAYLVTRDNFGIVPAQVAGVSLLTDYILTVAVSTAAGTAALASAFSELAPYRVEISVAFIVVIAFGNLRGVRESGRIFAVPTYFFVLNMAILLVMGMLKMAEGHLGQIDYSHVHDLGKFGSKGTGILQGASMFVVLSAFAAGGAAVTGVEAISNGVPAFRKPEWRNARQTLVVMGSMLGVMFLGLSILASHVHVRVFEEGTPTVISQIGDHVYGSGALGRVLYFSLQAGTMLILVLAANTSFADFPRLASFQAGDSFMPRQLTKRGHRLVFSNGIIFLSTCAIALVIVTGAKVDRLIPLYAVGVFTSFTLSQSGMARHHLRLREPAWRRGLVVNGFGACLSFVVLVVIAVTKFTHGAWFIVVVVPVMVTFLLRLERQYATEDRELEEDVPAAVHAPVGRKLVVLVFIDRLDMAAARAVQFGRTLRPDDLRAVHFVIDPLKAERLAEMWRDHGLADTALELVDCPDRRLTRTAMTTVASVLAEGGTEVAVLIPERLGGGFWRQLLHDQTAQALARDISRLDHATVTTVPFQVGIERRRRIAPILSGRAGRQAADERKAVGRVLRGEQAGGNGARPIATVAWREHAKVRGRVQALSVVPRAGTPTLEVTLVDDSGGISVVFLGRREIRGIELGTVLTVEGRAVEHDGRLAILNPIYRLDDAAPTP